MCARQESIYNAKALGHKASSNRDRIQERSRVERHFSVRKEATNGTEGFDKSLNGFDAKAFNVVEDIRTTLNE